MLHAAVKPQDESRDVLFIHCAVNSSSHAFLDEVRTLEARHPRVMVHIRYSEPTQSDRECAKHNSEGLIDSKLLDYLIGKREADYYFCGPRLMLASVYNLLKERAVPESSINYEFFGPAEALQE